MSSPSDDELQRIIDAFNEALSPKHWTVHVAEDIAKVDTHSVCCPVVPFDEEKSESMSSSEVRKKYPRIQCKVCGTVNYASYLHYLSGDW